MSLKRVTFTGADDHTGIEAMLKLSEQFPWVEWGILLPFKGGASRFPGREWVTRLIGMAELAPFNVNLAGHICPPWTEAVASTAQDIGGLIGSAFDRIQINTHGHPYVFSPEWPHEVSEMDDREYILQLDGLTNPLLEKWWHLNVTGLFDLSHGAGVLPGEWPKVPEWFNAGLRSDDPVAAWIGYAGGLGPDNIAEQLPLILTAAGRTDIWIDMETKVRTSGLFDLDKCKQVIDLVAPYIA